MNRPAGSEPSGAPGTRELEGRLRHLHTLRRHPITGQAIRYGISGAIVALLYLALPIGLDDAFGWPLQALIPLAYVLAVALQFTLQRVFVFRHEFALSIRAQAMFYLMVAAIQYPATALGTFALPKLLGISDHVAFIASSLSFSLFFFLFIRRRVFHPSQPMQQLV